MFLRRLAPSVLLSLVALALWCFVTDRWTVTAWQTPLHLLGDPLEIYARVQAAREDLSQPLRGFGDLPRLAAPFGADWSRYPISDRVVFTLLGGLARGVGLFTAVNLALAAVHVLNALAFYHTVRFLRWRRAWAFALALLFSFSCYNFYWAVTVSFSLTFAIPPLLLLCGWIARRAPAVRPRTWLALALLLGLWFGGANPYLLFFAGQLVGWSVVLQWSRRREPQRWQAGAWFVAAAAVSFLLHNAAYFLADTDGAASRHTLARTYAGSEIYALKLTDLVIPPVAHVVSELGALGRAYEAQSILRTEFSVNYLGVAGLAGLVVLLFVAVRPLLRGQGRVPDAALGLAWTLIFSAVGGLNSLLAFAGLDLFRASNRNSIFILVWALFFLGRACQRWWRPLHPALTWAAALAVAALGLVDSIPRLAAGGSLTATATALEQQRTFLASLEHRLGPGARIFQLPATSFPEEGPVRGMTDYEHVRPYLLSHTLHFSYGALRGTDAARSLRALGQFPAPQLKAELETAGFAALWIDRRGLPDDGAELLPALRALGLAEFPQTAFPHVTLFLLQPSAPPRPIDPAALRFHESWNGSPILDASQIAATGGWYELERDGDDRRRWARDTAGIAFERPAAGRVQLVFTAYSIRRGELVLTENRREIYRAPIDPGTRDQRAVSLELPAGRHEIEWRYTGRLTYPTSGDSRKLGFRVENLRLVAEP